jgi:hypothetical protein
MYWESAHELNSSYFILAQQRFTNGLVECFIVIHTGVCYFFIPSLHPPPLYYPTKLHNIQNLYLVDYANVLVSFTEQRAPLPYA